MHIKFCHTGREHLGIEYLSAVLKQSGLDVTTSLAYDPGYFGKQDNTLYNPFLEKVFSREKEMLEQICKEKPDVVAFSAYTANFQWIKSFAQRVKDCIETTVVVGGSHATLVPEIVIAASAVDFVVIGEGENTFVELVRFLQSPQGNCGVDNVYYKKNGVVIKNRISPNLITDLDSLPYPDRELFEKHIPFKDDFLVLTSRGCPNSCTFCCESFMNKMYGGRYFRQRSVRSMIAELDYMKAKYQFQQIIFFDNILHYHKKWMADFLAEYRANIKVPFKCMGHVNSFDRETAKTLKESGCYAVNFGIQSMDVDIREKFLNRNTLNEQVLKAFSLCDDAGLWFDADLMFDLPGEENDAMAQAAPFFKKFKMLNRVKCFNIFYFPKLEIVDIALKEGVIAESDVRGIENGEVDGFFRAASSQKKEKKKAVKSLKKLYAILPILPLNFVQHLSSGKRYLGLHFLPDFFVICVQVFIGIKNGDRRFYLYFKNYRRRFYELLLKILRAPGSFLKR